MNGKKTIFIGIIGLIISIVLLVLIVLLSLLNNTSGNSQIQNPVSNPVSSTVNIIDLNNPKGGAFEFAVIRPDDTIELRNKINEKFIIGLEKRNWKEINWSPDSKLVSALGESKPGIYDIYIYNISRKEWNRVTDFQNFTSGVDNYVWIDNNTIFFTQGENPTRWIHRYNYISKETLKLANIAGDIVMISPNREYIVVKAQGTVPEVYNNQGTKISVIDSVIDIEDSRPLAFEELNFFSNSEKVLGLTTNDEYYKFNIGDVNAVKVSLNKEVIPLCSVSENTFYTFQKKGTTSLIIGSFASREDVLTVLIEENFRKQFNINRDLSYCANGTLYLKIEYTDGTNQWYKFNNTDLEADAVLNENKDTDVIKK